MACPEEPQRLCIKVQPALEIQCPPDAYKNESYPRGALFISNCMHFDDSKYEKRLGSNLDVDNVKSLFTEMGYNCISTVEDLTREDLIRELDSFTDHNMLQEVDSLVAVFMSHGEEGRLLTRNGKYIKVEEICNMFDNIRCPKLRDKPKVFLFQHCRGTIETASPDLDFDFDGSAFRPVPRNYPTPGISHAFLCFSTRKGFVSYRDIMKGGFFIENLCKVFMEKAKDKRLVDLIGEVNYKLSKSDCRQSCEIQFINHHYPLYFNPGRPYKVSSTMDESSESLEGLSLQYDVFAEGQMEYLSAGWGKEVDFKSLQRMVDYTIPYGPKYPAEGKTTFQQYCESALVPASPSSISKHCVMTNYVFILSYLLGCDEDIRSLELKCTQMNFKVIRVPPVQTLDALKKSINSNGIIPHSMAIVFFFGEGYDNYLYLGKDSTESVSFKAFTEAFRETRQREYSTMVFTNTCFKYKSSTTILRTSPQPLWNAFHVCVKVNGNCSKGSLFTRALLQELELDQSKEEFVDFACRVKRRVEDSSANDDDQYIVDIRYYGVYKP